MAASSTSFKKGQVANPTGRPKKERALTTIMEKAGNVKVKVGEEEIAGKQLLAKMVWQAVTMGKVVFPTDDPDKTSTMPIFAEDWLQLVKFIYSHIDGPPKTSLDVTSNGETIKGYIGINPDDWDGNAPSD